MTLLPPLNGLKAFEVAGRRLNFRAAADEMGVTQGAVAQQVRQLEAHLGLVLFDRLPKGLSFTPLGRSYHVKVSAAFEELRKATVSLNPDKNNVRISVTPTFAAKWLIPNLPSFSEKYPTIDLQILATEKVASFHSDGIDLAIRQGEPPFGAALEAILLFRQDIVAVASPGLVKEHSLPLNLEIVSELTKIHDAHDLWSRYLKQLGIKDVSGRGLQLSQTALAMDAAVAGQGIALVSRFLAERDIATKNLVQILDCSLAGSQNFYLLRQRNIRRNPDIEAVVDWFVSHAEGEG